MIARRQSLTATSWQAPDLRTWFPVRGGVLLAARGQCKAVDGVSLSVWPGETVGLVGESGCGKSTLGKSVVRLVKPTGGQVLFEGTDLASLPVRRLKPFRREVQMIFQDPADSLNSRLTVGAMLVEQGYLSPLTSPGYADRLAVHRRLSREASARLLDTERALETQDHLVAAGVLALGAAHEYRNVLASLRAAAAHGVASADPAAKDRSLRLVLEHAGAGGESATALLERLGREGILLIPISRDLSVCIFPNKKVCWDFPPM